MDSGSDEGKDWANSVAGGRPDSSVLLRKPGDVFDLQFSIGPPRHGKQRPERRDLGDDIRAHCSVCQFNPFAAEPPFWPYGRRRVRAAGSTKVVMGAFPDHFINELLHLDHRRVGEANGFLVGGALGGARSAPMSNKRLGYRCRMHPPEAFVFGGSRSSPANDGVLSSTVPGRHAW